MKPNSDPSSKAGNHKVGPKKLAAIAAAAAVALAACSNGGDKLPPKSAGRAPVASASPTTIGAPGSAVSELSPTTSTTSLEQKAEQQKLEAKYYVESPERNQKFDQFMATYGSRAAQL